MDDGQSQDCELLPRQARFHGPSRTNTGHLLQITPRAMWTAVQLVSTTGRLHTTREHNWQSQCAQRLQTTETLKMLDLTH